MPEKKERKKKAVPEPFWNEMVEVYFSFCREKFHDEPTFDGSAPRDLKTLLKTLRERAERSCIEWSLNTASFRFRNFLEFAYQDQWLKSNWLLSNINRQKDKIFFNIRAAIERKPVHPFD